jgi:uncharacterized protein (TIGR04255 family)
MGEKLKAPPLVEAVCQFSFSESAPWDWTLPGRLFDRIGAEFSEKAALEGVEVQLAPGATQVVKAPDRLQMKRQDGSAMVQVGPHMLAINQLVPYPGWEAFLDLSMRIYGDYAGVCGHCGLSRIGLRYINQIVLSGDACDLAEYTTLDPPLKGALSRPLAAFYQRYELQHESPPGILVHQTGIQKAGSERHLMIDLDFGSVGLTGTVPVTGITSWLNAAHERIHETFVASLNPALYERLRTGEP